MTDVAIDAEATEVVRGDVVTDDDRVMVPAVREQESALEAAARAALEEPGIPGRDEFLSLAMQARVLSMSALAPKALQGKPADVFMILLAGRDLGISTTASLRKIYVVDGQPSLAPILLNMRIRRMGLGRIVPAEDNDVHKATAIALGPDDRQLGPPVVFTWEDAQRAELVRRDCQPDNHSDACMKDAKDKDRRRFACKDNYRHYPARMLWWRAAGYAADDYFPEAALGTYSPDELGAVTDENGNPIDPATVELPEGYGPKQVAPPEPASDEDRAELRRRIEALPPEGQDVLKQLVLESRDREGVEPLGSLDKFPARQLPRWKGLVSSVEDRARKGEWGEWQSPADPETGEKTPASTAAQEPQEPEPAAEPAVTPQGRSHGESGANGGESDRPSLLNTADTSEDVTIALVKAMGIAKVDTKLAEYGESVDGNEDTRRARLVMAMLRDNDAQRTA